MDNFSLPSIAVIGGASGRLTKEDADTATELGKIAARLGIRVMTKWRDQVYDALVIGANTVGKAPLITSLDDKDQLSNQLDSNLSLNRTYALHLISSLLIILPGGVETLADASYLIWQGDYSTQVTPLIFWGMGWDAIIGELYNQEYLDKNQKSQIIIIKHLEDIEKRLTQLV
jgi:predicted Rossmann-fold nucleotide-binding protein